MLHVCPKCGRYAPELSFAPDGVRCPFCGEHTPYTQQKVIFQHLDG